MCLASMLPSATCSLDQCPGCDHNHRAAMQEAETWVSKHGSEVFSHPWCMQLFLGKDENGDMIPIRQLRDRYRQQREDIFPKGDSEGLS